MQLESLETHKTYDAVVTGTREAVVFAGSAAPPVEAVSERSKRGSDVSLAAAQFRWSKAICELIR